MKLNIIIFSIFALFLNGCAEQPDDYARAGEQTKKSVYYL